MLLNFCRAGLLSCAEVLSCAGCRNELSKVIFPKKFEATAKGPFNALEALNGVHGYGVQATRSSSALF